MTGFLIAIIICIILSAFFSGCEMAFVTSSEYALREKADGGSLRARLMLTLKEAPQQFLASILIGNNIINITATALLTYLFEIRYGIANEWVVTATMVPLLLIFGEMLPKDYCRLHGMKVLLGNAPILDAFAKVLHYPSKFVLFGINKFLDLLRIEEEKGIFVSEREFRMVIDESTRSGVIEHHEKQLIDMILDFERIQIKKVMTPIANVPTVELKGNVKKIKTLAKETHSRMVLVYEEEPSIVVGMVYVFDLLFERKENQKLKNYLRSPTFLPENTSVQRAFLILQQRRQSNAVVTDSKGEVVGVVSIETLLSIR